MRFQRATCDHGARSSAWQKDKNTAQIECPICYTCIERVGCRLDCGHWYHPSCIDTWMAHVGNAICPYCRQAPTELEAHKQQTRALLIQWGMQHRAEALGGDEFAAVYDWGQQHRLIDEALDSGEFDRLAHDVFVGLVAQGDFVQSDLGFVYQWE